MIGLGPRPISAPNRSKFRRKTTRANIRQFSTPGESPARSQAHASWYLGRTTSEARASTRARTPSNGRRGCTVLDAGARAGIQDPSNEDRRHEQDGNREQVRGEGRDPQVEQAGQEWPNRLHR